MGADNVHGTEFKGIDAGSGLRFYCNQVEDTVSSTAEGCAWEEHGKEFETKEQKELTNLVIDYLVGSSEAEDDVDAGADHVVT